MVFVTVDEDRVRLETLTKLLVRTFPGSVIYQYTDPVFAVINMENRKNDVVFADLDISRKNDWQFLLLLRRKQPELQVVVLADDEQFRENAMECGARGYLVSPVTGQELHQVMQTLAEDRIGLNG